MCEIGASVIYRGEAFLKGFSLGLFFTGHKRSHRGISGAVLVLVLVVVLILIVVVVVVCLAINDVVPIKNRRPLTYIFLSVSGKSPSFSVVSRGDSTL